MPEAGSPSSVLAAVLDAGPAPTHPPPPRCAVRSLSEEVPLRSAPDAPGGPHAPWGLSLDKPLAQGREQEACGVLENDRNEVRAPLFSQFGVILIMYEMGSFPLFRTFRASLHPHQPWPVPPSVPPSVPRLPGAGEPGAASFAADTSATATLLHLTRASLSVPGSFRRFWDFHETMHGARGLCGPAAGAGVLLACACPQESAAPPPLSPPLHPWPSPSCLSPRKGPRGKCVAAPGAVRRGRSLEPRRPC